MKLIAIYARVSTAGQEEEQTIQTQISTLKDYAHDKGFIIVKEYKDDGWSGDILARPDLDQLRQDAKAKIWEAVLIYDPDRLARRYSYQELVMDELREAGIEVIFITVSAPKNPEDKILHGVRGLFAEYERVKISERFRLGKVRKVKEGHILVSEPSYGYIYIKGDRENRIHGRYEINPEEARVAKMIFTWIGDEGLTIRAVVRRLQELGIKPRRSKRGVWNTSTLTTILRNKAYIGEAHWGSSYAVVPKNPIKIEKYKKMRKSSRRIKPEEEWIASKIPVPAIIDRELFEMTREQLKRNATFSKKNKKNEYLLGGKILCSCGIKRHGEGPQNGKHLYYRCSDRIYGFPLPPKCKERGINARITDKLVWDKVVELMSSPDLLNAQVSRWSNGQRNKISTSVDDTKTLEKEIGKLKEQEDRYNKAYGAGAFTIEQLKEYTTPVKDKINSLEYQIAKAKQEKGQMDGLAIPSQDEIKEYAEISNRKLLAPNLNFELKRAILMNVIDKVIGTQQQLQVYGYLPITQSHVEYETSHRYCRSAKCWKKHFV